MPETAQTWAASLTIANEIQLAVENVDLRRLLVQAGVDAAEQKAVEKLQHLVLEELHHRVKNTLATVMAIASQTLRTSTSLEGARHAIEARLLALSVVQDMLLQARWSSAPLSSILETAIQPYGSNDGKRFTIKSSTLEVSAAAVLPLSMVLNELCTNAVKYGALSKDTGGVEITAGVNDLQNQVRLVWTERGGPRVEVPTRRSFGTKLIEQSFVRQLNGEARLSYEPDGVVCVLDIPLASLVPSAATTF